LSVDGSDSPDPVNSGTNLIYTILVVNNGPATANNVMVTNVLPAGIAYESAITTAGSCAPIGGQVVCNLGSLTSGGSATVTLATMATMLGTHTAVVSAFSSTPDLNTNNNIATIKTSVAALALQLVHVNDQRVLRWLAPATGYVLQQSTGLNGGSWVNVPGTPTVVNGEKTMVINVTNVARFYRLKAP